MRFWICVALIAGLAAGCSNGDGEAAVDGWFVAPVSESILSETVEVVVGFEGPVEHIELRTGEQVLATADVGEDADGTARFDWDTTQVHDGVYQLTLYLEGGGAEHLSEPVEVTVDNNAPVATLELDPMELLEGEVEIPVAVEEANLVSLTLVSDVAGEIATAESITDALTWDTTQADSRLHRLHLVAIDAAGHEVETDEVPVIVGNGARLLDQGELMYDPSAWMIIPEEVTPDIDIHNRVSANQGLAGTDPDNIVRVVTWITWESDESWTFELAFGQGLCPHRGVAYAYEESDSGLVVIDQAWVDVPEEQRRAALQHDSDGSLDQTTYPYNADPLTCGAFFAHINPLDYEDHLGEEVQVIAHFVFIYGE